MAYFWVNLGTSYKEVADHNFLWAPAYSVGKNGKKKINAGWEPVKEVEAGDVIFCHRKGSIIYVAVALNDAYAAPRPSTRKYQQWEQEGTRIDVQLTVLTPCVDVAEFKHTLLSIHNDSCVPALFTKQGTTSQQYMIRLPLGAGALILSHIGDYETDVWRQTTASSNGKTTPIGGSREAIIQARVGQGPFRSSVLSLWNNRCPVTGLAKPELLIASHIVPWSLSNDIEKVDPNNGFPFSPAVDKLFDRGYISFANNGRLLINDTAIDFQDLQLLGISPETEISGLNRHQKSFLARHREIFHFDV